MINKTLRRLAVGASAITVLGVVVPLAAATSASAAEATGITATPSSQTVTKGTAASYSASLTPAGSSSAHGVDYALTAGPSGTGLTGTPCTDTSGTGVGPFTCSVATSTLTPGTYTVTIFDNVANTGTFQNSDPSTTVSLTVAGTASNYTVAPPSRTAAQNMCAAYTGTAKDSNGTAAVGQTVALSAAQTTTSMSANGPAFCDPTSTTFANATPQGTQSGGPVTFTDTASGTATVAADGTFSFGVKSDTTGTVNITVGGAASPTNNPVTATLTVDAGTSTTNTQQANNDVAKSLTVSPTSQNAFVGKPTSYSVTVKNTNGDVIGGVQPSYIVTAGPDKNVTTTCTVSNGLGQSTCAITPSAAGTDSITTFVEQDNNPPNNATGPNTGEPQATSTVTVTVEPTFNAVASNCAGALNPTTTTCTVPASQATEVVTFTFTQNNTASGGSATAPSAGQTVNFSTPTQAGVSISPASATTDANGNASVTVTHTAGTGNTVPVTATLASDTTVTRTVNVVFTTAAASTLTLTPTAQTKAVGSTVTVTATTTDQFGAGVAGQAITFAISNASRNNPGVNPGATGSCTTAASGSCTFSYVDKGPALTGGATGTDSITATDTSPGAPAPATATVTFVAGTATASTVTLTANTTTANTSPAGTVPTDFVTANVKDANGNNLANDTVTFTSNGVGTFESPTGASLGTSTTVATDGSGNAKVFVNSTTPGTQTVTASADGVSSQPVTITYTNAQYNPVTPIRLIDSRNGTGNLQTNSGQTAAQGPLAPNTPYRVTLSNTAGSFLPGNTKGIVVNVAAIDASGVGNLRIAPNTGGTAPPTGALSYQPGKDVSNGLVLPYASSYTVYSDTASANFTMDLEGYYTDGFIGTNPPTRVANTLTGNGGTIAGGTSRAFQISGVNGDGVPTGAKAVAINVTAVNPSGLGNLRVYPDGQAVPGTANISYITHQDKSAFVVVPLPADGKIDVFSDGSSVNAVVDVFGYYPSVITNPGPFQTNPTNLTFLNSTGAPVRVLAPTAIAANTPFNVTVAGKNGIPADAQAVVVSIAGVHAANSTGVGNLRAYPAGAGVPNAAVLDYVSKTADVANFAIVKIGTNGQITLYSDGSPINGVVDVFGYVPAGS